jgi:hypothetical protein
MTWEKNILIRKLQMKRQSNIRKNMENSMMTQMKQMPLLDPRDTIHHGSAGYA